jgi:cytosine/adenosine deaminase-related metal-dependent hydrolase
VVEIIKTDYIYTPDGFCENKAVAFKEKILEVDTLENLQKKYPKSTIYDGGKNSILYPGFINPHVHLEFTYNKTILEYGDFIDWLGSVIENRETLLDRLTDQDMNLACNEMLESGVTTFGAISSFGLDLNVVRDTPQKVVYFNEAIGSEPGVVDVLYADFLARVKDSQKDAKKYKITPAVAVHAPYSIHPIMAKKVIEYAKENSMPISAHFMESSYEREWLDNGQGRFMEFFAKYFKGEKSNKLVEIFAKYSHIIKPLTTAKDFLKLFDGYKSSFVHSVYATKEELQYLKSQNHSIIHCPRSNRNLGLKRLEIENIDFTLALATDGLSSNNSLNLFDELRAALMLHSNLPLKELAQRLIKSVTIDAASAIGSDAGKIEVNAPADFALVKLPQKAKKDSLALHTILHTKVVDGIWIDGVEVLLA